MKIQNTTSKSVLLILTLLLSTLAPIAFAAPLPTEPGNEDYMSVDGLLDSDTYTLYPYEEESISIGFSKYGEMIDGDTGLGLKYKGVDVFANGAVPEEDWCSGWIMDIHFTDQTYLKNIWAYALYSDFTQDGIGGPWQNFQQSKDASATGDEHGGRRTNGYAESDDIKILYDGPRKAIYLLNTTIYDKDEEQKGTPLVSLTIQLVFDKVSKNVMEIKDIKRIDNNKMTGPFQIEFSQRAEWDIGLSGASESYAEFYDGIPTKYDKHPFYNTGTNHDDEPVNVSLCQIIGEENLVGYAAFWPPLISKWVDDVGALNRYAQKVDIPDLLDTMETYEYYVELPEDAFDLWPDGVRETGSNEIEILLPTEPVAYPRGLGEWSKTPWVFKKDSNGYHRLTEGTEWYFDKSVPDDGAVYIERFNWGWDDEFVVIFKRVMQGAESHQGIYALECMPWKGFEVSTMHDSLGMSNEPDTPIVIGEWDFDLNYDMEDSINGEWNSTHQFRCVSVYGVTDNHNAVDPDQPGQAGNFRIDEEVVYQLNQIFNPWDLPDAVHLDSFRWAQKGTIGGNTITLSSHDTGAAPHTVWVAPKWGYYCEDSEKVLVYTGSGAILLERDEDYDLVGDTITLKPDTVTAYDGLLYKVLYSTRQDSYDWHTGQFEWTVLGEASLPSDSLGASMLSSAWSDWKNIQCWVSGLDMQAYDLAPGIPSVMRTFAESPPYLRYYHDYPVDNRTSFRDDWCTPDDWAGETIHPKAISSADLLIVGGPLANDAAMYFNDFTDSLIFTGYGDGFYAPGCWARTTQPHYQGMDFVDVTANELWYDSITTDDTIGHAIVSTYKDLNETVGFVVYGYTAEDTYYMCHALRGGMLAWMQGLQAGVTTLIVEIDYEDPDLHPVKFHVKESLGRFTECTGFDTDFKCQEYYGNLNGNLTRVTDEAIAFGMPYKYVDIEWCAQLHPDP